MGNTSTKPHPRSRHKKQVHWKAADRPSPPGKPQLVADSDTTPDVVTIRWDPPRYDGGSPITGYLVEHRRYGSPHWVRATPLLVPFTELSLSGLEPGWRYQFRVSAENAVGLSAPGELSELLTVTLQRSAVTVPRFLDELKDSVALENEKVEFVANFLGQPMPKICWFKDGFEIFSSRRIRIITENDKSTLTIHQSALSDEGEIKCTATNRAGHASTKARLTLEAPPSIRLPRQYEDGLLFELGEVMRLKVSIAGRPTPLVFWTHNGESIKSDDRYEIETTDKYSSVRLEEVKRSDRGEYQVKAINKLGETVASFLVTVTDKPSPPGQARVVMTLGRSVTLAWSTPTDDGGCKIGNYIVEYFRIGWDVWLKAATCRQLTTTIGELIEGSEYKFRVKAESPYGVSEPGYESDVIFIPDPKRGILTPSARSRSQPRDIFGSESVPVAVKRQPRSQSSTRAENIPKRTPTPVHFYEGGVPVRPVRTKVKSPSITPEPSPVNSRRNKDTLNKNIFDRSSMARDLAYGTPDIHVRDSDRYDSEIINKQPALAVRSTVSVVHQQNAIQDRTPSPNQSISVIPNKTKEKSPSPTPAFQTKRSLSPASPARRSPSPVRFEELQTQRSPSPFRFSRSRSRSPVKQDIENEAENMEYNTKSPSNMKSKNDPISNSSEFMLLLLPEMQKGRQSASDIKFNFDENLVPPPLSLSAPELGAEPPLIEVLRAAVSSTELLHEHAMERFYQALEAEEADIQKKHNNTNRGIELPKIQINSKDDQVIVGLEKKNSFKRRLSGGGTAAPSQLLWAQRRHSLRNTPDLSELPENNLRKYPAVMDNKNQDRSVIETAKDDPKQFSLTVEDKRQIFSARQRSESEEREEEEFEKVRMKMALQKQQQESSKSVGVTKEEDWDEYEESVTESETESSGEDERLKLDLEPPHYVVEEEEIYHPKIMNRQIIEKQPKSKSDEPFEILTKPNPLPDPNFIPKPILKRRDLDGLPAKPVRKIINSSSSGAPLKDYAHPHAISNDLSVAAKTSTNSGSSSKQRSFSPIPQSNPPKPKQEPAAMRKRGLSPIVPNRELPAGAALPPKPPPVQRKKSDEEIKVVVDHYGDIVRSYGQKKRSIPQVYLNADDLKAAAERQSKEDLREIERSMENLADLEDSGDNPSAELEVPDEASTGRRRSFVLEASSALLKTVKERVSAAFAPEEPQIEDDIIPPDEVIPPRERRGSSQVSRRRLSKSPNKLEMPKAPKKSSGGGSGTSESNWSNLRAPSPTPQGRKGSPSPMRRTSLIPPSVQTRRTSLGGSTPPKPKMKETTTQTPSDLDPKKDILLAARQEELSAKAELKVRSTVDYITDLAMFIVACWLYLFQNELLAIPVLLVMVYRQLKEEIKKKLPRWMLGKKKTKRK